MNTAVAELDKWPLTSEIRSKRRILREKPNGDNHTDYERNWDIYNSSIEAYLSEAFNSLMTEAELKEILSRREHIVAIDFLASTAALASLFWGRANKKMALSVAIEDNRSRQQDERDARLGIQHLVGDISRSFTWQAIEDRLDGDKADLILERGAGGLDYIPKHRRFYGIVLKKAWTLLSAHDGLMLIQTPTTATLKSLDVDVYSWLDLLTRNRIEAEYAPVASDFGGALRISKTIDSPPQLPLLAR